MDQIHTSALTNHAAMRYARRVSTDLAAGMTIDQSFRSRGVPEALGSDLRVIMEASAAGWFAIPNGPGLTYSKAQHGRLTSQSSRAPWLIALMEEATAFEAYRTTMAPREGKAWGVRSLPDFREEAMGAQTRLTRLPHEHAAGEITLDLWVQILIDTQAMASQIRNQMDCLRPAWMWGTDHPLAAQIQRLKAFDCLYLLLPYVSTTRNKILDTYERKLLEDVQYRGMDPEEYRRRWEAEQKRRIEEDQSRWQERYGLIRKLASILDGASSYHQGTLNRRIKQESKGAFQLRRSDLNSEGLVIEIQHQYCVGQAVKLDTAFKLVNYCLALADEVEGAKPEYADYLDACNRAYGRIKDIAEPSPGASRQLRPRDDFDPVAA